MLDAGAAMMQSQAQILVFLSLQFMGEVTPNQKGTAPKSYPDECKGADTGAMKPIMHGIDP